MSDVIIVTRWVITDGKVVVEEDPNYKVEDGMIKRVVPDVDYQSLISLFRLDSVEILRIDYLPFVSPDGKETHMISPLHPANITGAYLLSPAAYDELFRRLEEK